MFPQKFTKKTAFVVLAMVFFFALLFSYIPIVHTFFDHKLYMRFPGDGGTLFKGALASLVTFLILWYSAPAQGKGGTSLLYPILFVLNYVPEVILYVYAPGHRQGIFALFYALILLFLGQLDRWPKGRLPLGRLEDQQQARAQRILLALSAVGFLIFFLRYGFFVSPRLFLLGDVYAERRALLALATPVHAYLKNQLTRVIFPLLLLLSLDLKRYPSAAFAVVASLYLYLCTAVKTDLFVLVLVVFFYIIRRLKDQGLGFLGAMNLLAGLSILEYILRGSVHLYELILRRVVFVPAMLNRVYYLEFSGQPVGWGRAAQKAFLSTKGYPSIQTWMGEAILKEPGNNASVGIVSDAFLHGGYWALVLPFLLMIFFAWVLKRTQWPAAWFGVPMTFLYVMNSSFMGTLLLTHGLFAFFVAALLLSWNPQKKQKTAKNPEEPLPPHLI
ncbi:hypothetical protein ABB02_01868 [Clostridiaceae bacterium JG1575]|nr:hypothetical protein ABB02_01868 [Clostridiaceae bacterium JG1575]